MEDKLRKTYLPMTETAFYILLSLVEPRHGYAIIENVAKMTNERIKLGPGTIYGSLSKMNKDQLIQIIQEESNRKIYQITKLGNDILLLEKTRIEELYRNSREV
ncbi:PadR family transcriptional regulator [Listeria sp. FSL L7-0091]|uniref:PadR family transcriptional regulator n=1 Tax=Listeria farberi TaxID=2713500 RepID=A0A7X1DDT8_9LIST|nr:PadR family transcriptional regulator [Listeria farberi]MBC1374498.1 PadR family transcriptional regulator [Listeria farberi]MBC1380914.1 PadR family transcriptional regulator [Listeria farberi]MBC2262172.1 PadR family transcriptional regulator [Listeria farberi]MBC2267156.1 PadR family transcriptional regulator [Listeria farberi]MBC2286611.1 PadR family transcriptional regulator [Listeria farberi]